jgi:hypothetical protein
MTLREPKRPAARPPSIEEKDMRSIEVGWLLALAACVGCSVETGADEADGKKSERLAAPDFCRALNEVVCQKAAQCDPGFEGTAQDCRDYLDGKYCVGVTDYQCPEEGKANSGACLDGVRTLSCGAFNANQHVAACDAMSDCSGGGTACDCSTVFQDCTVTYDALGNPTEHCTCSPSCCC